MSTRIGRNDPCHCGSGKKYKKCHLALDEQSKPALPQTSEDSDSAPTPLNSGQIATLLRQVPRGGSSKERAELDQFLAESQPIMAYLERRNEIQAASTALEAHRQEFARLLADERAYLRRIHALFAEDRFAPLRFTAADIRRAFDTVGYPPNLALSDEAVEIIRAAILHLADKSRRSQLSMNLLLHLPDCVAAGRQPGCVADPVFVLLDLGSRRREQSVPVRDVLGRSACRAVSAKAGLRPALQNAGAFVSTPRTSARFWSAPRSGALDRPGMLEA